MTVYTQSVSRQNKDTERKMMNISAAGLQRGLLDLLRQSSLKRLSRIVAALQRFQVQQAVRRWQQWSESESWSGRHQQVEDKISRSCSVLSDEQARQITEVRQEWKDGRSELVNQIGYQQEDCIAVGPDDVHKLRALDKKFRERLYRVQQEHIHASSVLSNHCEMLRKDHDDKRQTLALEALGRRILEKKERSRREAHGRTWHQSDIDTGILQWCFTQPPDPCMVPFPMVVAMEDQQETLAQTCRLIFEYADKLPRWGALASVNQGRPSRTTTRGTSSASAASVQAHWKQHKSGEGMAKPSDGPQTAAASLLKSILRRLQVRSCLQPAFHRLLALPSRAYQRAARRSTVGFAQLESPILGSQGKRASIAEVKQQEQREQGRPEETKLSPKTMQRKTLNILRHKIVKAAPKEPHSTDDDSAGDSSASTGIPQNAGNSWDQVSQVTERRTGRRSVFMLGEEESPNQIQDNAILRRPSFTTHTPRSRAATVCLDRRVSTPATGVSADLSFLGADETPADRRTPKSKRAAKTVDAAALQAVYRNMQAAAADADPPFKDTATSISTAVPSNASHSHMMSLQRDHLPPMPVASDTSDNDSSDGSIPADGAVQGLLAGGGGSTDESTSDSEAEAHTKSQAQKMPAMSAYKSTASFEV